jgi:hypothetical protein
MVDRREAAKGNRRPISVTVIACVYLVVGVLGFVFHFREALVRHAFGYDTALIELTEVIAFVSGVFLLRASNWARWLALAWMLFHGIFSAFGAFRQFAVHTVICIVIAWALFHTQATRYFQSGRTA